jgi:hypothetical protein
VREFRTLGSARGAARKGGPYRDWRILPVGDISRPATYQRLSDTVDPQEIQAAACEEESLPVLAGNRSTIPTHVRALGMDCLRTVGLVIRMTRAR